MMADPLFIFKSINPFSLSGTDSNANTFVDIDNDGDLDAFVGNNSGDTLFYKNIGAANNPVFAAAVTNPFGLSSVGYFASPTFVDIDGDGDLDAFVGGYFGDTKFYRNTGTANNPVFTAINNPFSFSVTGINASPTFADIDGDGDLDAFVGISDYNTLLFYRNTGTAINPVFAAAVTNPFGLSLVGNEAHPTFVDIDGDGDLDAFIGTARGDTQFYRNTGTAINPTFTVAVTNPFGLFSVAERSDASPTFVDIDGDGDLDALVAGAGGIMFYSNVDSGVLLESTAGNNILTGTASNNDTVTYAAASAAVTVSLLITVQQNTLGAGLDTLTSIENLIGGGFDDNLRGNAKNNLLVGDSGNDILNGGGGADTLFGGWGNDNYFVENAGDVVAENPVFGTDTVNSSVTYTLPLNVENLNLTGALAINGTGNDMNNIMNGNAADNQLIGGLGNDVLNGRAGTNSLTGGIGSDIFRFAQAVHTDTITDYNVTDDTIQLENALFTALTTTGPLAANQFRVGAQALDANDYIIYHSAAGKLLYDADGNGAGAAVQIAIVGSGLAMTSADIVVT